MSRERHQRAKALFLDAVERSGAARAAYLDESCADDAELRAQVEAMLAADEEGAEPVLAPLLAGGLSVGEVLGGRYVVRERVGEGGLGEVWRADQTKPLVREVAVKVVKLGMDTRQVIARFEAERQTLAILDHPNIAKVLDAGATSSGRPYFVMEFLEGEPLIAFCRSNALPLRERLQLFLEVCAGVQHAHQKGVVHRDLKPSNVLATSTPQGPRCQVIDFGIAKVVGPEGAGQTLGTGEQQVFGTPAYMSPEQAEGSANVDTTTDVYSLGVLLYELLTDSTPLQRELLTGTSLVEVARLLRETEPERPSTRLAGFEAASRPPIRVEDVRGDLDWIVLRAIERERERRYGTVQALAEDVRRFLAHEPIRARPPSRLYQVRKFVRRNRLLVGAGLLLFVSLLVGVVTTSLARDAERVARLEAEGALAEADEAIRFLSNLFAAAQPQNQGSDVRVLDALAIAEELLSTDFVEQPRVEVRLRRALGITHRKLGNLERSIENLERALELARDCYPSDDLTFVNLLGSLTSSYDDAGRFSDSEPLHREVLALRRKHYGVESRGTLGAMCNFGLFLYDQGRHEDSLAQLEETFAHMDAHLVPEDTFRLICLQGIGNCLLQLGRLAEAEPCFREVLALAPRSTDATMGPHALVGLSDLAAAGGDDQLALELLAQVESSLHDYYPEGHWRHGAKALRRAELLLKLGRLEDAVDAARGAHANLSANFGEDDPDARRAARLVAEQLEALGRREQAAAWRSRAGAD